MRRKNSGKENKIIVNYRLLAFLQFSPENSSQALLRIKLKTQPVSNEKNLDSVSVMQDPRYPGRFICSPLCCFLCPSSSLSGVVWAAHTFTLMAGTQLDRAVHLGHVQKHATRNFPFSTSINSIARPLRPIVCNGFHRFTKTNLIYSIYIHSFPTIPLISLIVATTSHFLSSVHAHPLSFGESFSMARQKQKTVKSS